MGACPGCLRDLPDSGFLFCPWCAAPLASPAVGQRKTVTVLIADLADSTKLGGSLDPEVLRAVMSAYWVTARTAVERHGGRVAKFIGDAVVVVFGLPVAHEDDAMRAVRAATDLLSAVAELNVDLETRLGLRLVTRIGVNTGQVMVDSDAEDGSLLAADVANICARLEQAAGHDEVLLGEATFLLVRDGIDATELTPLQVKGRDDPVIAFRLDQAHPARQRARRRRVSGPIVGRQQELVELRAAYDLATQARSCVLATVLGAPGVGKSRLVEEVLSQVRADAWVLEGRCLPYGDGITYWPAAQMLQRLAPEGEGSWQAVLADAAHGDEIALGLDSIMGSSSAAESGQMAWAFRRLLETLAQTRPVVVVVDDVQWAEPALLDLFDHVTERSHDAPILIMCLARPEFTTRRPGWGEGRPGAVVTELSELTSAESRSLTESLLGGDVDPQVLERVTGAAAGIPLFVEEFVASLVDQSLVEVNEAGYWKAVVNLEEVAVPPTVQALLAARLDRLPAAERRVIDSAAVIGQTFYPDALTAQLGSGADVRASIKALQSADLIRSVDSDVFEHDAFAFAHLLIRDAAYDGIPKARRAIEHEAVARWLDSTSVSRQAPELIASHLQRAAGYHAELGHRDAALSEEAASRLISCADRARQTGDLSSAEALLDAAARLVDHDSTIGLTVQLAQIDVVAMIGDYAAAFAQAERVGVRAKLAGDQRAFWHARVLRSWVALLTDPGLDFAVESEQVTLAIDVLEALEEDRGLAMAYLVRCTEHAITAHWDVMGPDARRGVVAAKRCGDRSLIARLLRWLMISCWFGSGTVEDEERIVNDIVTEFGDDSVLAADVATYRAVLRADQGYLDEAIAHARSRAALAIERGNVFDALSFQDIVSGQLRAAGDLRGAAESLRLALELAEGTGETAQQSTRLAQMSIILARMGQDEEARATLARGRQMSHPDDLVNLILFPTADGLLLARQGQREESEACFSQALEVIQRAQVAPEFLDVNMVHSTACEWLGDGEGALAHAREALLAAEARGRVPSILAARKRVAECASLVGGG